MESFSFGWNWNPVIFLIVLAVSLVLSVKVLKKWQVAWVIPALVLYAGLEWALPYSWLFKTIFWIAVLVAVVTAFLPGKTKLAKVPVGLAVAGLVIAALGSGVNWISGDEEFTARPPSGVPTEKCPDTWEIDKADYGNTRWFADGIREIDVAKTETEARSAVNVWIDRVKQDPLLLQSAVKTFLKKDVKQEDLVTDGCGSETAVQNVLDIETVVAKAKVEKVKSAPKGTVTTGVDGDKMLSMSTSGNDGAVHLVLQDKREIWIERDCGNVVTEKPIFPPNPKNPPDTPEKKCPPDMPHGVYPLCKDDPSKDPAAQGNAPIGGGLNEDPGPGTYIPPGDMEQPPSSPYTPPPPPPPAPPSGGDGGGSTPTPDSDPPPEPEPEAPPSDDPVSPDEGSGCAPGMVC